MMPSLYRAQREAAFICSYLDSTPLLYFETLHHSASLVTIWQILWSYVMVSVSSRVGSELSLFLYLMFLSHHGLLD